MTEVLLHETGATLPDLAMTENEETDKNALNGAASDDSIPDDVLDCAALSTRDINRRLKEIASTRGEAASATLLHPDSRHNLAVGIVTPMRLHVRGPVGYYCAGLCDGVDVRIEGGAGWGLAENLMGGRVRLQGSAGSSAGATMHGGSLIIGGDAGARCGVAMKGGTLVVGGDAGVMTGFMMQKGAIIVGGDAGDALGDSLYEGLIFVRGVIQSLGSDAQVVPLLESDALMLARVLASCEVPALSGAQPGDFKKIESARRLYNFDSKEKEIWKSAL